MSIRVALFLSILLVSVVAIGPAEVAVARNRQPMAADQAWIKLVPKIEPGLKVDWRDVTLVKLVNPEPVGQACCRYGYGYECRLDMNQSVAVVVGTYQDRRQSLVLMRITQEPATPFMSCPRNGMFLLPLDQLRAKLEQRAKSQAIEAAEKDIVRQILDQATQQP